jgi:hypothetical protein
MTTDPESKMPKLMQRWDQGPEAARMKYEAEQAKAETARRVKREENLIKRRLDLREKLLTEKIQPMQEAKEGGWFGVGGQEAGPVGPERLRTPAEAEAILNRVYGPDPQAAGQQGGLTAGPQAVGAFDQVFEEMKGSLTYTKAEHGLPERVAMAQALLREAKKRGYFSRRIDALTNAAIQEALQIGAEYSASTGGG